MSVEAFGSYKFDYNGPENHAEAKKLTWEWLNPRIPGFCFLFEDIPVSGEADSS